MGEKTEDIYWLKLNIDNLPNNFKTKELRIYVPGTNKEADFIKNSTKEEKNKIIERLKNGDELFLFDPYGIRENDIVLAEKYAENLYPKSINDKQIRCMYNAAIIAFKAGRKSERKNPYTELING